MNRGLISWISKKQPTTSLSSVEAEFILACQAIKELVWLRKLLEDIGLSQSHPILLKCDSQSCIAMTKNSKFHGRTMHIEVQYHFL